MRFVKMRVHEQRRIIQASASAGTWPMARRRGLPAASGICALPDDIVLEILMRLPAADRLSVVPCVCKRWQSLHGKPSRMWSSIIWKMEMPSDDARDMLLRHMDFLRHRLASVQDFKIVANQGDAEGARHSKLQTCLALLSAAPNLRSLVVHVDNLPVHSISFVRMLSGLRRLRCLYLVPDQGATTADSRRLKLFEPMIQGLDSLEELALRFNGVDTVKATGFPKVLMQCSALTTLIITVRHVSDMLQFDSLPATLFRACSGLRKLALNNCGVRAVPPEVACATGLTRLQLLSAKPPEGAPLPHVKLPPHITKLQSLSDLQLSSSAVPPTFVSHLTNLYGLTLDQVELTPEDGVRLHQLLSMPRMSFVRLCNAKQLAATMAAGPGSDAALLRIMDLCLDGNGLTSCQLPHVLSWFDLGALDTLDLRYNDLSHLPKEIKLMTALRKLDVSRNAPLVLARSDAHLFAGLLCFEHLTVRAWKDCIRNEAQAQILLDIQQKFVNSTACSHLGRWEDAEDDTWDDELDSQMCLITDHINIPPANNNALLLLQNPD